MTIVDDLNSDIEDILVRDPNLNTLHGRVCIICDKLLAKKESSEMGVASFKKYCCYFKGENLTIPQSLRDQYVFSDSIGNSLPEEFSGCLFSPRSKLVYKGNNGQAAKVVLCKECRPYLNKKRIKNSLPRFAIANGMTIGTTPECISSLNDVELALVSQARYRGHLFSYWGGCHRSIKGWHSFYDVDVGHTVSVLEAVKKFTSKSNIAVVLCGPMTTAQRKLLERRTHVDVQKVRIAFDWLKANNVLYKDMPVPEIGQPVIIDTSENVESVNTDIESREEITVVFPSGDVSTGGCENGKAFEQAMADIRSKCKDDDPSLFSKPSNRALRDFSEKNLIKAFPAQFPCGHGGHEDLNVTVSQNGYLNHL